MKSISLCLSFSVPVLQRLDVVHRELCSSVWDYHCCSWGEAGKCLLRICTDLICRQMATAHTSENSFSLVNEVFLHMFGCKGIEGGSTLLQEHVFSQCASPLPGTWWPRAALRLLGADRISPGRRSRQPAERGVGRGCPAQQQTHADQRGERLQDPASAIHGDPVLQGPFL